LAEYRTWVKTIKERISSSRIKASLSVNHELIALYWFLGSQIAEKQKMASWGSGFIDQFSKDLKEEFLDEQLDIPEVTALYGEDIWMN